MLTSKFILKIEPSARIEWNLWCLYNTMLLDGIDNWDAMLTNNVLMRDKRFDTLSPIIRTDKRKNNKHFQLRLSQLSHERKSEHFQSLFSHRQMLV